MSESFNSFKQGLWTGNAIKYRTIAQWIEEDLAAGRTLENYPDTLRAHADKLDAEKATFEQCAHTDRAEI